MGIFEQFPYTNFHDLNLDWILHAIRSMDKKLDEFVASNVLSYADPIQWDIETQYAKNTVVIDPKTGTAYMSINPVPVGQLLTNKYYWQPIFNYDEIVNTLKKQIAAVQADQHDTIHVEVNRGDLVWIANKLYRLTKSLDAGSKIIENENAVPITVEDAIINIDTTKNITRNTDGTITDTAGTITRKSDSIIDTANDAISVSGKTITNVAADSITNSSTNITDTATGDVTVSGRNITNNVTENREINVNGSDSVHINGVSALNVGGQRTEVYAGDKTESVTGTETVTKNIVNETVNNLNLVGKNELKFKSDSLVLDSNGEPIKLGMNVTDDLYYGTLKVREATGNVREIMVKNNGTPNLARKFNNYILVGDSYAGGYTPEGNVTGWPVLLHGLLKGNLYGTITQGGAGLSANLTGDFNLTTKIDSFANSDEVDSIICCCGRNDIGINIQYKISEGIKNFVNKCHEKFKNAKIYIGFIGWDLNVTEWEQHKAYNLATAIAAYKNVVADYTYINTDFILRRRSFMASDGKHPNQNGENALAYGIQCALYGGFPGFSKGLSQHTYKNANDDAQTFLLNETFTGGTTFLQFATNVTQVFTGTSDSVMLADYSLTIIRDAKLDFLVPSEFTSMQATVVLKMRNSGFYRISAPLHFKPNSDGTYDIVMNISLVNKTGDGWVNDVISYFWIKDSLPVANDLV